MDSSSSSPHDTTDSSFIKTVSSQTAPMLSLYEANIDSGEGRTIGDCGC